MAVLLPCSWFGRHPGARSGEGKSALPAQRHDWLTVKEAADLLRVPVSWLYERTRTNSIPHVKLGKYLRFDQDEPAAWVEEYALRYYNAAGRRRWQTIGPNLHEARKVLAERMWERRHGKFRLDRQPITTKEFATKWNEDYVTVQVRLGRMKESSAESCRSRLRLHVVPFFGQMRLDAIALPHVRDFMKALLAEDLSPKTVLNVMVVLKEMLKQHAVQWGYLDANPAQYAERPRGEEQEMQILTPPEIRRLLDAADEPTRTLILCAVLTGMRRGELLGLRWEDIDLEGHRVFARRALWRGKIVTPKSRR
ncbi:MAG TPA: helix-turn-helix domain-containing protein [Methylomirabilota bacterium]|nr:helix-turn-helix domain-containing protein [Methylomirabilota bacterium]